MNTFKSALAAIALMLFAQIASAEDTARVVGVWKLLSFEADYQDGRPRTPWHGGLSPSGYIIFTKEGRMMSVIEGVGRKPAKTDEERGALLRSMFAYTGIYRLEGDKWVTKVDASWNPAWTGTEQMRFYKVDGDRLEVVSEWMKAPNLPGEATLVRGVLLWELVK